MRYLVALLLMVLFIPVLAAETAAPVYRVEQTLLADPGEQPVVSPDLRHVAWIAKQDAQYVVVLDGKPGKAYDTIYDSTVRFSPNSRRLAYFAMLDGQSFAVIDGQETAAKYTLNADHQLFSPDSAHIALITKGDGACHLVVDGQAGPAYDEITFPTFSPDSARLIYVAQRKGKKVVVEGNNEGLPYDDICSLTFSPDGRRLAFSAKIDNRWHAVVGDKVSQEEDIGYLWFSPDSERFAFLSGKQLVIDGKPGRQYDRIDPFVLFSPDSRHVLYLANRDRRTCLVIDRLEQAVYLDIGKPVISPDGKHLACCVVLPNVDAAGKQAVVLDGVEYPKDHQVSDLTFSADSRHLAYRGSTWTDALDSMRNFLIYDGRTLSAEYRNLTPPVFSPDGSHVLTIASNGQQQCVLVDGHESQWYDAILAAQDGNRLDFDGNTGFHYLARKGNQLVMVDERLTHERWYR